MFLKNPIVFSVIALSFFSSIAVATPDARGFGNNSFDVGVGHRNYEVDSKEYAKFGFVFGDDSGSLYLPSLATKGKVFFVEVEIDDDSNVQFLNATYVKANGYSPLLEYEALSLSKDSREEGLDANRLMIFGAKVPLTQVGNPMKDIVSFSPNLKFNFGYADYEFQKNGKESSDSNLYYVAGIGGNFSLITEGLTLVELLVMAEKEATIDGDVEIKTNSATLEVLPTKTPFYVYVRKNFKREIDGPLGRNVPNKAEVELGFEYNFQLGR